MFQNLQSAIKTRAILVFGIVHLGLILALAGLFRSSATLGWETSAVWIAVGLGFLYFGFLLGVFLIVAPIWPWVQRARRLQDLSSWLIRDLPLLLEHLPKIIAAVKAIAAAWVEVTEKREAEKK
jgi:hypothetical protein